MSSTGNNSEVSKKLKAAIRAKLEELGVYVDDELPDYIMVMIANKKDSAQMKDDLGLFIGKSTGKFVDWLFDLFDRLQTASSKGDEKGATAPASSSSSKYEEEERKKKEDERKKKEAEQKKQEERERHEREEKEKKKERERHREREREREQREREREREREKERQREKERAEQKRREEEREERARKEEERSRKQTKEKEAAKNRRSRSKTWSDDEFEERIRINEKPRQHQPRSQEKKKVASTVVVQRPPSASPEPQKVSSTVVVKRNIRSGDTKTTRARSQMFLKAMKEASVSAGYGASESIRPKKAEAVEEEMNEDSDEPEAPPKKARLALHSRITKQKKAADTLFVGQEAMEEDDAVVLDGTTRVGGPKMIVKLAGGKEALKRKRVSPPQRIVIDNEDAEEYDPMEKAPAVQPVIQHVRGSGKQQKRRREEVPVPTIEEDEGEEPKRKHQQIVFDLPTSPTKRASRHKESSDSPTMRKWDGQIQLGEESNTSDEEAEIDAVLASVQTTRGGPQPVHNPNRQVIDEEKLPPTHQLSGGFAVHANPQFQQTPTYVPTPLSVLQEQQHPPQAVLHVTEQSAGYMPTTSVKEEPRPLERCHFWPQCTKGDSCPYHHPTKNCTNFPNCSFGSRCLFIHPPCRFDKLCTKKKCPFTHYGTSGTAPVPPAQPSLPLTTNKRPMATVAPQPKTQGPMSIYSHIAAKLAAIPKSLEGARKAAAASDVPVAPEAEKAPTATTSMAKKVAVVAAEKKENASASAHPAITAPLESGQEAAPSSSNVDRLNVPSTLQNMTPCRFAGACRNPVCQFKHPKECRYGANCTNSGCYFYHKPASAFGAAPSDTSAKYKWSATSA